MKTLTILILGLLSFLNLQVVYGQTYDYLESATTTHTATTVNESTAFTDLVSVSIDVGTNTTESKYVLVAAGINMRPAGSGTSNRRVYYNILGPNDATQSGQIDRLLIANNESDVQNWGVGTLVHIFDVSGLSGNQTFTLKHQDKWGVDGNNIESSVNLTAVALSTENNNYKLNNAVKRMSSNITSRSEDFESDNYLTTNAITLPIKGDVYVSASINVGGTAPGSVAEFQLQSSDDNGNTWSPLGKPVQRSMMTNYDDGIVSLVGLFKDKDAGDYKFRLAHRRVSGDGDVNTHNVNLVAVALAHEFGYFPAFYNDVGTSGVDITGLSAPAATVTSTTFTAAAEISSIGTNLFVHTQYLVSASNLDGNDRMRAGNQLKVSGASSGTAQEFYRYIPNNSNLGAGGFIGLMKNLVSNGSYAINMEHQIVAISGTGGSGDETLKTSEVILCGFQTYDQPINTWQGTTTNWETAANWSSNLIPNDIRSVNIPAGLSNYPIIAANTTANCNNLTIASGATLTIESDATNNGSLIVTGTSTGDLTYKRWMTKDKWHIVGPPVVGQEINSLLTDENNSIAYKGDPDYYYGVTTYGEAANDWDAYFTTSTSGDFSNGTGYLFRRQTTDDTVSFTGTQATGDVTVPVTFAGTGYGWNCVGNPYTSAIGANTSATSTTNFLEKNTTILDDSYEALYIWDQTAGDYIIINNSGFVNNTGKTSWATNYIQAGQGFIVRANAGGNVEFNTEMQIHQPTQVFKSAEISWPGMVLTADREGEKTSTTIAFNDEMTKGLDPGYDAGIFKGGNDFNIFTQLIEDNGVEFGLQCLPLQNLETIEIPVGLDATIGGEITLSIEKANFPASLIPVLNDKLLNTQFVFNTESDVYTTTANDNTKGFGRFTLTFSSTTNAETILSGQVHFKAWHSNGFIYINGEINGNAQATVYDINGRKLAISQLLPGGQNKINAPESVAGIYLVKVKDQRHSEVLKVPVFGR